VLGIGLHVNLQHTERTRRLCLDSGCRPQLNVTMSSFESTGNKEPASSQDIPSSDPHLSLSPQRQNGIKERRQPSITPRKFGKFFTPRSQASKAASPGRQALNNIAAPPNNRLGLSSPIRFTSRVGKDDEPSTFPTRDPKKRKLIHTPDDTPNHLYIESKENEEFEIVGEDVDDGLENIQSSPCERAAHVDRVEGEEQRRETLRRIISIDQRGLGGKLLQSMSGLSTRSRWQQHAYPVNGKVSLTLGEIGI
jgi:hypothetical protein